MTAAGSLRGSGCITQQGVPHLCTTLMPILARPCPTTSYHRQTVPQHWATPVWREDPLFLSRQQLISRCLPRRLPASRIGFIILATALSAEQNNEARTSFRWPCSERKVGDIALASRIFPSTQLSLRSSHIISRTISKQWLPKAASVLPAALVNPLFHYHIARMERLSELPNPPSYSPEHSMCNFLISLGRVTSPSLAQ